VIKRAVVDRRRSEYIVASYSLVPDGFWQMNGTYFRVPVSDDVAGLGRAVREALSTSNSGSIVQARPDENPLKPLLTELGLRGYSQYMRGTRSVAITSDGEGITVTPYRNGGAREGFVPIAESGTRLAPGDDRAIGAAVSAGMALAV
jgi:hypothetical protein